MFLVFRNLLHIRDDDQFLNETQAEFEQVEETISTIHTLLSTKELQVLFFVNFVFVCELTFNKAANNDLPNQIEYVSSSLKALLSYVEWDKALARALKTSAQLQKYLGSEAESLAAEISDGVSRKASIPAKINVGDIEALFNEFRNMEFVDDDDPKPEVILVEKNFKKKTLIHSRYATECCFTFSIQYPLHSPSSYFPRKIVSTTRGPNFQIGSRFSPNSPG